MIHCHHPSIRVLEELLDSLPHIGHARALEVAAGDGQLSKDLLRHRFKEIDCFDQCPKAVKRLEQLQERYGQLIKVD